MNKAPFGQFLESHSQMPNRVLVAFHLMLAPVWYLVTQLVPKNPRKACFGAWFGAKYADNSKYLYETARRSGDVDAIWITKSSAVLDRLRGMGARVYHAYSVAGLYHQVTSKFFFCCVNSRDFAPFTVAMRTKVVQLWHGMPLKKIGFDTRMGRWSRWKNHVRRVTIDRYAFTISPAPFFDDSLVSAFLLPRASILRCPLPRCDGLFVDDDARVRRRARLGVPADDFLLVYLPTHRDEGRTCDAIRSALDDLASMGQLLADLNITVIVKPHFYDAHFAPTWPQSSRVRVLTDDVDVYELLALSDGLLTDYSSVAFDYAVLGRPILAHCPDLENYRRQSRDLYHGVEEVFEHISLDRAELAASLRMASACVMGTAEATWLKEGLVPPDRDVGSLSDRAWTVIRQATGADGK